MPNHKPRPRWNLRLLEELLETHRMLMRMAGVALARDRRRSLVTRPLVARPGDPGAIDPDRPVHHPNLTDDEAQRLFTQMQRLRALKPDAPAPPDAGS